MFKSAEELREHVGRDEYDVMKKQFGGQRIYINQETKRFDNPFFKMPVSERNALFLADYWNGMKPRHLSEKYGLKISYVRRLLHLLKKKEAAQEKK